MNRLAKSQVVALLHDTRGANMVEYIIIVGLVAIIAIAGFTAFGGQVTTAINGQGNTISTIPTSSAAAPAH